MVDGVLVVGVVGVCTFSSCDCGTLEEDNGGDFGASVAFCVGGYGAVSSEKINIETKVHTNWFPRFLQFQWI